MNAQTLESMTTDELYELWTINYAAYQGNYTPELDKILDEIFEVYATKKGLI
jgi:hypothetical protein